MLNSGFSFELVAKTLILDDDTVRNYLRKYQAEGVSGLLRDLYVGGQPQLHSLELGMLKIDLQEHVYLSAKEVCEYVRKTFGVKYSVNGMTALLHRLGFVYKKPKLVPGKANAELQRKFLSKYRQLKRSKEAEDQIYFADGCHPMLNPIAGYGWILKGAEKEIPSNTGRERLNLNGAYNPETGKAILVDCESVNAQSTIELFKKIQKRQPFGKIFFISDNARYYRSEFIKEYLRNHRRIKIIPLPSYSPNLNLIERLWHFYKKKVLYNRHYETLSEMRSATQNFFSHLSQYNRELRSLMTENFQIITPNFSEIRL